MYVSVNFLKSKPNPENPRLRTCMGMFNISLRIFHNRTKIKAMVIYSSYIFNG